MAADTSKNGVAKPSWTCPNGCGEKFTSQRSMIQHALPCKRGELKGGQ